jgi:serine/threonine protein kinase
MSSTRPIERIGRYQVLERVGKGGMGVLYRGFDPVLDREVAIKLMHADFTEDTEQMRPRFYREARAAAKLNHRNIVTIFEFAEESNVPYIVMEFLRGMPLNQRMSGAQPLSLDDKLSIVAQLCDGLAYAHEQGVVHRDVKPDNVFLLEDGSVKLLDFGIAKLTASNLTREGDVLGSASYMSPEQVDGSDSVDGRADVFSTGVLLYELLTGHKPFEAENPTAVIVRILRDQPTPLDTYVTGLPHALVAVVLKALSREPASRFATADAMGRELQSIRRTLEIEKPQVAELDETRVAGTAIIKALHEEMQRRRSAPKSADPSPQDVAKAAEDAFRAVTPPPIRPRQKWTIPAATAAVVLVAIVVFAWSRGSAPVSAGPGTNIGTSTPPASPPGSSTGTSAASTPAAAGGSPAPSTSTGPPPAVPAPVDAVPKPVEAASINVRIRGGYPFQVTQGGKVISPAKMSHQLKAAPGQTLVIVSREHFMRQTVTVTGAAGQTFDWAAPGLGGLDVRSLLETCDVMIGDRKLGNPPLKILDIAEGQHRVNISCDGSVVKSHNATVRAGQTSLAAIR